MWRFFRLFKRINHKHVLNGIDRTKTLYDKWEEAKKKAKREIENGNYEDAHEHTVEMDRREAEIRETYEECVRIHNTNLDACKEIRQALDEIRKAGLKLD